MTFIEWMETPAGRRYRAWSTVSDCYLGPPVDRAGMLAFLVRAGHTPESAESTLARIDEQVSDGLSSGRVERWSVEYDEYGDPVEDAASAEASRALGPGDADR